MNWDLATKQQLETIVKHDNDCPLSLLREAVVEMLNRGLFDRIIYDCIHKTIKDVEAFDRANHVGLDDMLQNGRIEILSCLDRYDSNKGKAFMSFAYMCVKRQLYSDIVFIKAKKRDTSKNTSYDLENDDGVKMADLLPSHLNVERFVTHKMMLENMFNTLTEHQKKIVFYHMQGYNFGEISKLIGKGTNKSAHQVYKNSLKKMYKGA